ncbi:MAG: c-type cytochrome [Anaeromyxobacteraceae bacterium]
MPLLHAAFALALLAAPGAQAADEVARGAAVARRFCYACHDAELGPRATNPLASKLRPELWGTPEQAYANIGRLSKLNPSMTLAFDGPEVDRRALAAYVAALARENRPAAWRTALGLAALAAVVGGAAAWARRRFGGLPAP